jgi:predicted transport protein
LGQINKSYIAYKESENVAQSKEQNKTLGESGHQETKIYELPKNSK